MVTLYVISLVIAAFGVFVEFTYDKDLSKEQIIGNILFIVIPGLNTIAAIVVVFDAAEAYIEVFYK